MDINLSQVGKNVAIFADDTNSENVAASRQISATLFESNSVKEANIEQAKEILLTADKELDEALQPNQQNLEEAISEVNEFVQTRNKQLNFSVDDDSGKQVVKVTDSDSGDIIRQIPTEEVLSLSRRIKELQMDVGSAVGMFFDKQA
ncbi:flagellar protein FlaG [Paraglaciecola chathamensis]|uniref:flagellar protein FlaG n=1 Tax=Paraglaciecola chathamensis TaxID=368405 RepID=UPI00270DE0D6|nr:flagellar protein FlaG [Paraglaciecola chathamensis]MDO6558179.1 flagellar protein FlaG [Paraglaciecola chathamensis]